MRIKKWIALWLCLLLLTGVLVSCKQRTESPPLVSVNVIESSRSLLFLPFYLALELNCFQKEGLDITLQTAETKELAFANLFSLEAPFYLGGPENALYHLQKENPESIVFLAKASTGSGAYLIARKSDQPFSWQQLKGKTIIGANIGVLEEVVFEQFLKKNNLKPFLDVHIIQNLPSQLIPGTFQAGSGQYLLATEPTAAKIEIENNAYAVHSIDISGKLLLSNTIITTESYFKENSDVCQKFIKAFNEGLTWLNEHTPEEIVEAAKKYFPLESEKVLTRAVSRYKTIGIWPLETVVTRHDLAILQEVLNANKMLNSPLPLDLIIIQQ